MKKIFFHVNLEKSSEQAKEKIIKIISAQMSFIKFLSFVIFLLSACGPIRELKKPPVAYSGDNKFDRGKAPYEAAKKQSSSSRTTKGPSCST